MMIVIRGIPRTKKNSQEIHYTRLGKPFIAPSKQVREYRLDFLRQITGGMRQEIDYPVNVKCVYYMPTKRRIDLVNLLEATCDLLQEARVVVDDRSDIVAGHDGSRVLYDRDDPRVEITITPMNEN